jgi:hypothetical protein
LEAEDFKKDMKKNSLYEKLNNTSAIFTTEGGVNNSSILNSSDKDLLNRSNKKTPEKKNFQFFDNSVVLSPELFPNDKTLDEISIDHDNPKKSILT